MSEENIETPLPKSGFKLTHELKYFITVVIGLAPCPFLWNLVSVHETANEITVRHPLYIGLIYVPLACYAVYEYIRYLRTDESPFIPGIERYLILPVLLLGLAASHFCGTVVSVDQQKFVVFEPIMSLLEKPGYDFGDVKQIQLGKNNRGNDALIITRQGASRTESISCDALVQAALPKLATAAKAKGVDVVGF